MGEVTLHLPSYAELELITLNLLRKLLSKCGLGQPPPVRNFVKLLRDETKPDRETVTIVAITRFLRSY